MTTPPTYSGGVVLDSSLTGTELVTIDNGGAVIAVATTQAIANLARNLTGNLTVGNITVTGAETVTGNVAVGNLSTTGSVAAGNVTISGIPNTNPHVVGQLYTGNVSGNITVFVSQG